MRDVAVSSTISEYGTFRLLDTPNEIYAQWLCVRHSISILAYTGGIVM